MDSTLTDRDWENLLKKIAGSKCVPFLGAGACYGALPLGGEIAREWAQRFHYPMSDTGDLVRVSQFLAVQYDLSYPKELVLEELGSGNPPDFRAADEPHAVLADLPLKIYLTTNYDDFMVKALASRWRDPKREFCRWNELIREQPTLFEKEPGYEPTVARPLVYYLHGHTDPNSVVLTEDDYLTFLAAMQDPKLLPDQVRQPIAGSSLLFIGYRMADWNIRVLLQGLRRLGQGLGGKGNLSVMVLVPPEGPEGTQQKTQEYLDRYYAAIDLRVYWGTARQFCGELATRWKQRPQSS
ncbi:MAG: SIR2 family NAD-dependent protein deacylase [Isosphaeraceae bacterium]